MSDSLFQEPGSEFVTARPVPKSKGFVGFLVRNNIAKNEKSANGILLALLALLLLATAMTTLSSRSVGTQYGNLEQMKRLHPEWNFERTVR